MKKRPTRNVEQPKAKKVKIQAALKLQPATSVEAAVLAYPGKPQKHVPPLHHKGLRISTDIPSQAWRAKWAGSKLICCSFKMDPEAGWQKVVAHCGL